jgi:hypothetical protein
MQNAEKKKRGMLRGMVLLNSRGLSIKMSLIAIAFLAAFAIVIVASAHETGSPHEELSPLWPYHALLMSTGLVVMLGGMLTARYMKRKSWWLKAHKILGISGALLIISGVIVAVYMVLTQSGTYLVEEPHAYLGITALALVVFTPIMGFMQFRIKDKRMRSVHRWSGRLAITLVLINAAAGWMMIRTV